MSIDKFDIFWQGNASQRMPDKSNGIQVNWKALDPDELRLCIDIGKRASDMIAQHARENPQRQIITPHPTICAMEIGIVHLHKPLKLRAFLESDDLAFLHDYLTIARNVDRAGCRWDRGIPLNFYDPSLLLRLRAITINPRLKK